MTTNKDDENTILIKELDIDTIRPNAETMDTNLGGSKIVVLGKAGSGKSVLIKSLLYAKRDIIPIGVVVSGSEDTNAFYAKLFPKIFINEKFDLSIIADIHKRQEISKKHLSNAWNVFIMDDCMDDAKPFNDPLMLGLFKNSRHWNVLSIFANQYVFDFKPVIRTNIDGVFIFREASVTNRDKIYANFASIIPSKPLFYALMDQLTNDFTCIYINNQTSSNDWRDCVFYYKAPILPDFQFGCEDYWVYAEARSMYDERRTTKKSSSS